MACKKLITYIRKERMKNILKQKAWSPYVVGAGIGVLSWITFYFMGRELGISSTFVRLPGFLESFLVPRHIINTEYFSRSLVGVPIFNWQFALVISIFVGAFVSSRLSGDVTKETIPILWKKRFGKSKRLRSICAFIGGVIILFGARLAGGCTTGHGISGTLKLVLASWVAVISMFAGGIVTAIILYKKK